MKNLETIKVLGRYNEETDCAHLICDEECTLRLNNVIKSNDSYIYQIVIKSLTDSTFSLKTTTDTFVLSSNQLWSKLIQKFVINDNSTYIDLIFSPGEYWFYNTKLETGIIPTDWTPAPEDLDYKVYTIQSEFKQRTDQIEMSISSKQDIPITSVRYIRDWLNGNNVDNKNYWSECRIVNTESQNIVENETVTISGKDSSLNDFTITNIDKFIDGTLPSSDQYVEGEYATCTGKACVEIDLGTVHNDIDYIKLWHRFVTDDTNKIIFNHKLQVSSDGITWITLYDSDISGGYTETSDGRIYYMSETSVYKNINSLTIGLTESQSKIANLDGQVSTLNQGLDSISATIGANKEEADSKIESLNEKLQVASDIMATDTEGNKVGILDRINKLITASEQEPSEKKSGLWFHIIELLDEIYKVEPYLTSSTGKTRLMLSSNTIRMNDGTTVEKKISNVNNRFTNIQKIKAGVKVVNISSSGATSVAVFANKELNSILEVDDSSSGNTMVTFANGNGTAQRVHIQGATYENNTWYAVMASGAVKGDIQINYVIHYFGTSTSEDTSQIKSQEKTVTSSISEQVVYPDEGYDYLSRVTVKSIPYEETTDSSGGITVGIG